jgi:SAM-dependent methyltransferase
MSPRDIARRLAKEHLDRGDATGWFERLYAAAAGNPESIPWADLRPNPALVSWLHQIGPVSGRRALVIGSGLGDDAEILAVYGYSVVGFDISSTAVDWTRQRFSQSDVEYVVADVLDPRPEWKGAFDLVFEAYTLQVLPADLRTSVIRCIADCLRPDGLACVVARARESHEPPGSMPWPLTRGELSSFVKAGLTEIELRDFIDDEEPPVRRFFGVYRK